MSRKHYETLAAWIRDTENAGHTRERAKLASELATILATDNPRFDRVRFLQAAQPRWIPGTRAENVWDRETA